MQRNGRLFIHCVETGCAKVPIWEESLYTGCAYATRTPRGHAGLGTPKQGWQCLMGRQRYRAELLAGASPPPPSAR